jgi:GAF domain-containing protein
VNPALPPSLLDSVEAAVFATDADLNVLAWNAAMEARTGVARAAVLGHAAPPFPDLLRDRGEARIAPWRGPDGVVRGVTVALRDVASGARQDRFVRAIEAIGHGLTSSRDVDRVLDTVVTTAMDVMGAQAAIVVTWDGQAPEFDVMRAAGRLSPSFAGSRIPVGHGPLSRAALDGVAVAATAAGSDDLNADRVEHVVREGFQTVVAAPMVCNGAVLGAVAVYGWTPRGVTEDETAALTVLGQYGALAIDGARVHAEAARRAERLRALAEIEELVSGSLDLDEVLRRIAQMTTRVVDAPAVHVWTADPATRTLHRRASSVASPAIAENLVDTLRFGEGITGRAAELRTPIWVPDLRQDPIGRTALRWTLALGITRTLAVPIVSGEDLLGVFTIFARDDFHLTDEVGALISALATRAAVALQNARAYAGAVQRAARLHTLIEVGQSITGSLDVPDVMQRIAQAAARMRPGALGAVHGVEIGDATVRYATNSDTARDGFPAEIPFGRGLPGLVAQRAAPLLITDPASLPGTLAPDWWRARPGATFYGVPIAAGDAFVGVLSYVAPDGAPDSDEQESLQLLAAYAGIAMRNAALYQAERAQAERVRALATVNRTISGSLQIEELLRVIAASAAPLAGVRYASFWLASDSERTITLGGSSSDDVWAHYTGRSIGYDEGVIGWTARHRTPALVDDVFTDGRVVSVEWWRRLGVSSLACLPVMGSDRLLAVLTLAHAGPIRLAPEVRDVIDLFVAQAAIALQNARLYRDAERRRDAAESLARLGRELTATLDLDRLAAHVSRGVTALVRADEAAVYLQDGDDKRLRRVGMHPEAGVLVAAVGESVAALAVAERATVLSRDALADTALRLRETARAHVREHPRRAAAGVPLMSRERVIGALVVAAPAGGEFTPDDVQSLEAAAERAGLAIENARLYAESERERREAAALASAARRLAVHLDLEQVAEQLVQTLRELFQAHSSAFYRAQADGTLQAVALAGAARAHLGGQIIPRGRSIVGRAVVERAPVWTRDILNDSQVGLTPEMRTLIERTGNRAVLVVPLIVKSEVVGALGIAYATPRDFARRDVTLLQAFADQAALALQNARLYESVRDNLERLRATQSQLVQAAKMAAIGELVSGVAHELNNPLSVIIGYGQLLLARDLPVAMRRPVELMVSQSDRMAKIVKNLLLFARQRSPERMPVDLNEVVEQTLLLRQHQLELAGITVERDLQPGLPSIPGDAQHLQQVVLNLLLNAEQAILEARSGQRIVLRTFRRPDGRVVAQISDDGPGIPADALSRVFEPFFTTKEVGVGTGLGLSVSYGIIEEHGGRLHVESRPGATTFTMEFPAPLAPSVAPRAALTESSRGDGRLALVVEDEPAVQGMVVALLRETGWRVDVADGTRAALDRLRACRYDLVVTAVRMPDGRGEDLYRAAVADDPTLARRFLFTSGDAADPGAERLLREANVPVIETPCSPQRLLDAIRRMAAPLTTPR